MTLLDTAPLTSFGRSTRIRRWVGRVTAALLIVGLVTLLLISDAWLVLLFLGGPLVPLIVAYALLSIAAGRKSVVLYLRRFGRTASSRVVTSALESGLSARHRVIALDDARFPPLEVPPWERRLSRYGPPVAAAVILAVFVVVVRGLRQQGDYLWLGLSVAVVPMLAASLWCLLTVFLLLILHRARMRRLARARITSDADLGRCAHRMVELGGWRRAPAIMGPQATVVRVDDSMWQHTVATLAESAGAVLVDLSEPTANIAWEIETAQRTAPGRIVLVGDRDAVRRWAVTHDGAFDHSLVERVSALVEAQPVLLYDSSGRRALGRFRRSLMRALDSLAPHQPRARADGVNVAPLRWARLASAVRIISIYLLAPVLATLVSVLAVKIADPGRALASLFVEPYHPLDRFGPADAELRRRGVPRTPEALARAAQDGRKEEVDLLLRSGVPQTARGGWTPLLLAAGSGDPETLRALLQSAVSVEERTHDGRSALMLAAAGGHTGAVHALLDAGANVNAAADGRTSLGFAILGGHPKVVQLLLERGAAASLSHLGTSPLMHAAALGRADLMTPILAATTDVNARNANGRTALALTSIAGCRDCVRQLLAKGAGVDMVDAFGETALGYALFNQHADVVALLEEAGARRPAEPSSYRRGDVDPRANHRGKPHVNLIVAGDLGKPTPDLVSAMTKILAKVVPRQGFWSTERLDASRHDTFPRNAPARPRLHGKVVEFYTKERHYALCLPASEADARKISIAGAWHADTVILVASVETSLELIEEQLRLARQTGITRLVVAFDSGLEKADGTRLTQAEEALRGALLRLGYQTAPLVRVSTSGALKGDAAWESSIEELIGALDSLPAPNRLEDRPLEMVVEDSYNMKGRPAGVAVRVLSGRVRIDDTVELVGLRRTRQAVVAGISTFRKLLDEAVAGDSVTVQFRGINESGEVERGQVAVAPGSLNAITQFDALVWLFGPQDGGRLTPAPSSYRPQLYFRTTDVTGSLQFAPDVSEVMPGTIVSARVKLHLPIGMAPGLHFAVREGGRSVGVGVVTGIVASAPPSAGAANAPLLQFYFPPILLPDLPR